MVNKANGTSANAIPGMHHITAICDDPQQNIDFFMGLLGLRLVKQTVNFDMPDTYHLYYGDEQGSPGTILTFFSWPDAPKGHMGAGQINTIAFSVPPSSLDYWAERFDHRQLAVYGPMGRFDDKLLGFTSPDGLAIELIAHADAERFDGWNDGPIPAEHAIRGFHSVTMLEADVAATTEMLTGVMGFKQVEQHGRRARFTTGHDDQRATFLDVMELPTKQHGRVAVGSVHHIAWRTPGDMYQLAWREKLLDSGVNVTPVRDRQYFHSIYFNEPGGVLFEIATDPPGFTFDESLAELGTHLKLPPWLESDRSLLEQSLPALHLPRVEREE